MSIKKRFFVKYITVFVNIYVNKSVIFASQCRNIHY